MRHFRQILFLLVALCLIVLAGWVGVSDTGALVLGLYTEDALAERFIGGAVSPWREDEWHEFEFMRERVDQLRVRRELAAEDLSQLASIVRGGRSRPAYCRDVRPRFLTRRARRPSRSHSSEHGQRMAFAVDLAEEASRLEPDNANFAMKASEFRFALDLYRAHRQIPLQRKAILDCLARISVIQERSDPQNALFDLCIADLVFRDALSRPSRHKQRPLGGFNRQRVEEGMQVVEAARAKSRLSELAAPIDSPQLIKLAYELRINTLSAWSDRHNRRVPQMVHSVDRALSSFIIYDRDVPAEFSVAVYRQLRDLYDFAEDTVAVDEEGLAEVIESRRNHGQRLDIARALLELYSTNPELFEPGAFERTHESAVRHYYERLLRGRAWSEYEERNNQDFDERSRWQAWLPIPAACFVTASRAVVVGLVAVLLGGVLCRGRWRAQPPEPSVVPFCVWVIGFAVMLNNYLVLYPLRLQLQEGRVFDRAISKVVTVNLKSYSLQPDITDRAVGISWGWFTAPLLVFGLFVFLAVVRRHWYHVRPNHPSQAVAARFVRGGLTFAASCFVVATVSIMLIVVLIESDFDEHKEWIENPDPNLGYAGIHKIIEEFDSDPMIRAELMEQSRKAIDAELQE